MKQVMCIIACILLSVKLQAQSDGGMLLLHPEGRFATNSNIRQSSGLAKVPDALSFWTHNDQGYPLTRIYRFNPGSGSANVDIIDSASIDLPVNLDWEDMTKDNAGNLYIAQTGKNCNQNAPPDCPKRHVFAFHKVPFSSLGGGNTVTPASYYYTYPLSGYPGANCRTGTDTVFANVESAIWFNGAIYVFTKDIWSKPRNNCGQWQANHTVLFKVPLTEGSTESNPITAEYIASFNMKVSDSDNGSYLLPLAAAISDDQKTVALTTGGRLWIFYNFTGDNFFSGSKTWYTYTDNGTAPAVRGFEGMEFSSNTKLHLSVDGVNGRVMSVDLPGAPLATANLNVNLRTSECNTWLEYNYTQEYPLSAVELQVSADGQFFHTLAQSKNTSGQFLVNDRVIPGVGGSPRYVRLRLIDPGEGISFSKIERITQPCRQVSFDIYPNPAYTGKTIVRWDPAYTSGELTFTLYNVRGIICGKYTCLSQDKRMEIHLDRPGLYFLKIQDERGFNQVHKIVYL